jgi:chemotaxis protein methyltransferase CheR
MLFTPKSEPLPLTSDVFHRLRGFIYEQSGLFFPDTRAKLLADQLAIRLKATQIGSYDAYLDFVSSTPGKKELPRLFDAVTTWDTYFFRDTAQCHAFRATIVPELLAMKEPPKTLRVWSAGCSTGDEAYTIAILLRELRAETGEAFEAEILGTEISPAAVTFARRAVYADHALRSTPPEVRAKYFTREADGHYALCEEVREAVNIRRLNLANRTALTVLSDFDVIFCRNVITYFDEEFTRRLVAQFHNSLRYGGYLLVGHAESLHNVSAGFRLVSFAGALGYRKE